MTPSDNQIFESYVPVYDAVPEKWDDARAFIVEQLKRISTAINIREIGWFLDEELLSGKAFIPGTASIGASQTSQQYRSILRKVIEFPGLTVGANSQAHGININDSFSLMQLYAGATNSMALTGEPIPNGADTIDYDATNININVAAPYDRCWAVIEYIQEL